MPLLFSLFYFFVFLCFFFSYILFSPPIFKTDMDIAAVLLLISIHIFTILFHFFFFLSFVKLFSLYCSLLLYSTL